MLKTLPILLTFLALSVWPFWLNGEDAGPKKIRKYELVVQDAMKHVGTKYVLGGCQPGGFDCSGFVYYIYKQYGIELPRISTEQADAGKRVSLRRVQKGDLLFFRGSDLKDRKIGHVGIVISNKKEPIKFVHASTSRGIVVSELETEYYKLRYRKARRFKELKKKVKL